MTENPRSDDEANCDRVKHIYSCIVSQSENALEMCKARALARMRNQFCCCAIPPEKRKYEETSSNKNKNYYANKYLCPCLNMKDSKQRKVDFIANLPIEVSQLILRMLKPTTLFHAACVSKKWLEVCKSDSVLRKKARNHKQKQNEMVLLWQ
ncbi:hypothetical protein K0M31_003266 [Melipona bicolor]|uniref:F-box domain-containing protein n=1 Tax=Melipona bicolor TaxID=60889 RepID=A0AA40KPE9_9HYME|nr:hypothetical protein K0M31_003266 [Melipona bicolor]